MWVAIVGSRSLETCDCPPVVLGTTGGHYPPPEYAEGGPTCVRLTVYFLILNSLGRLVGKPGFEGIVSGGAAGVDTLAEFLARDMSGLKVRVYRPASEKGKNFYERAMARNSRIVKTADMVIAFFDPRVEKSSGTSDTVRKALAAGKEVHVWHGRWER